MATITAKELIAKFNQVQGIIETGKIVEIAARDSMSESVQRIFMRGQKSSGDSIGSYSTKAAYFSPKNTPKDTNHTGKTGKRIKTGYYAGGYAELRSQQGRESSFVNLRFTNELQSDYANASIDPTSNRIASPTPIPGGKNIFLITLNKQINIDKRDGLEDKYGLIFDLTTKEEQIFIDSQDFNLDNEIQKIFK